MLESQEDRSFLDEMLKKYQRAVHKLNVYVDHVGKRRPMHPNTSPQN